MGMTTKEFDEQTGRFKIVHVDPEGSCCWALVDTRTGRTLGHDGGEPEDQLLVRDWHWVREEMNAMAEAQDALVEALRKADGFLEDRFGNSDGHDWRDESAAYVADQITKALELAGVRL
jgi:hypothetical protein